jgi:MFS family permease
MDMTAGRQPDFAARTRWGYITLLLFTGICAAMQIGKVPPALSVLQRDLQFGIVAGGWTISMFSVIGAILGAIVGSFADRYGARRVAVLGLLLMALASAGGAAAQGAASLLVSRAFEGMGFVIVVIAVPVLLGASAVGAHKRVVPSLWGTYMPIGMAIALTMTPILVLATSWRVTWDISAALLILCAIALAITRPPHMARGTRPALTLAAIKHTLEQRGAVLLAILFAVFAFQHLAVLGFLPTILQEQGFDARMAGVLTAAAVLTNAVGNLSASWLIAHRVPAWRCMVFGSIVMALAAIGVYATGLSPLARYGMAVAFSYFGGLLPASIFATVAIVARETNSGATVMGLAVQASHVGQLMGPPAVAAAAVATGGWQYSPVILVPAALVAIWAALSLRTSVPAEAVHRTAG